MSTREELEEEVVAKALAKYAAVLSPRQLELVRAQVLDAVRAHPVMTQLVDQIAPMLATDASYLTPNEAVDEARRTALERVRKNGHG